MAHLPPVLTVGAAALNRCNEVQKLIIAILDKHHNSNRQTQQAVQFHPKVSIGGVCAGHRLNI